jgi:hypothetical protein
MFIALLALFVAIGGTGYAITKINGKDIKRRSIPANRVKPNSLTGKQIIEKKLKTVPSAADADTLSGISASGFARGGGTLVRKRVIVPTNTVDAVLADVSNGGELRGSCGTNADQLTLEVENTTSTDRDVSLSGINGFDPPSQISFSARMGPNESSSPVALLGGSAFVSFSIPGRTSITSLTVAHVDLNSGGCHVIITGQTSATVE